MRRPSKDRLIQEAILCLKDANPAETELLWDALEEDAFWIDTVRTPADAKAAVAEKLAEIRLKMGL